MSSLYMDSLCFKISENQHPPVLVPTATVNTFKVWPDGQFVQGNSKVSDNWYEDKRSLEFKLGFKEIRTQTR